MKNVILIVLFGCFAVVVNCATLESVKADPLMSGNRRREMLEDECENHGGTDHVMSLSDCGTFFCNDGTVAQVVQGTPCKLVINFGHCLRGQCLTAAAYLAATSSSDEVVAEQDLRAQNVSEVN